MHYLVQWWNPFGKKVIEWINLTLDKDLTYNLFALANLSIPQMHQNWKALLMAEKNSFHKNYILQQPLCYCAASHYNRLVVAKVISSQTQTRWDGAVGSDQRFRDLPKLSSIALGSHCSRIKSDFISMKENRIQRCLLYRVFSDKMYCHFCSVYFLTLSIMFSTLFPKVCHTSDALILALVTFNITWSRMKSAGFIRWIFIYISKDTYDTYVRALCTLLSANIPANVQRVWIITECPRKVNTELLIVH